eukprot:5242638-Prymnesium_polylepis.1
MQQLSFLGVYVGSDPHGSDSLASAARARRTRSLASRGWHAPVSTLVGLHDWAKPDEQPPVSPDLSSKSAEAHASASYVVP